MAKEIPKNLQNQTNPVVLMMKMKLKYLIGKKICLKKLVKQGKADPKDPKIAKYLNEEELNENVDQKISDHNKNEDDDSLPDLEDGFK